jgi:hypothetical protein
MRRAARRPVWRSGVDFIKAYGRWLLLALGVVAVVLLVRESGPERVLEVMIRAAPWLPFILLLEGAWISMDVIALRFLYGKAGRKVPLSAWLRSASVAYGVMILLPAGRAGGEVMRAAQLSKHVGMVSVTGAAQLQGSTLFANAVISIPCFLAVASGVGYGHELAVLVLLNGLATLVLGLGALFMASRSELGGRLGRKFAFLQQYASQLDEAAKPMKAFPRRAVLFTVTGRAIQALQYGIILLAIGGVLTPRSALVAQGIHLVGSGLGDMIPNAVGITEAAYRFFAETLGFAHDPARAIAIALVARLTQYTLAAGALLAGGVGSFRAASDGDTGHDHGT